MTRVWSFFVLLLVFDLVPVHHGRIDFDYSLADLESEASIDALFDSWCSQHGKTYGSEGERLHRRGVFKEKLFLIQSHNSQQHTYQLGLNHFSDKSQEEILAELPQFDVRDLREKWGSAETKSVSAVDAVPDSIDWRRMGAVTRVKDVGTSCRGATWAFAAAEAVEGKLKLDGHPLQDLSAQQLLDCVELHNTLKCSAVPAVSGLASIYIASNGLATEKVYPYTGTIGTCKPIPSSVTISGMRALYQLSNDTELLNAVAKQPVAVVVDGSKPEFINYAGGIYSGPYTNNVISTALLIVGYGTAGDVPFWTAKNSWGLGWGEGGYIRIQRNGRTPFGVVNINTLASFPTGTAPANAPSCGSGQTCPSGMTCCCIEPAIGFTCNYHMCCPSKYSDCRNGCCKQKKNLFLNENEIVENQTMSY